MRGGEPGDVCKNDQFALLRDRQDASHHNRNITGICVSLSQYTRRLCINSCDPGCGRVSQHTFSRGRIKRVISLESDLSFHVHFPCLWSSQLDWSSVINQYNVVIMVKKKWK